MMQEIGRQLIECGNFWRDPIWQRSTHVRALRQAVNRWAYNSTSKFTYHHLPVFFTCNLGRGALHRRKRQILKARNQGFPFQIHPTCALLTGQKKVDVELSAAIQACARLEHNLAPLCDPELFEATRECPRHFCVILKLLSICPCTSFPTFELFACVRTYPPLTLWQD